MKAVIAGLLIGILPTTSFAAMSEAECALLKEGKAKEFVTTRATGEKFLVAYSGTWVGHLKSLPGGAVASTSGYLDMTAIGKIYTEISGGVTNILRQEPVEKFSIEEMTTKPGSYARSCNWTLSSTSNDKVMIQPVERQFACTFAIKPNPPVKIGGCSLDTVKINLVAKGADAKSFTEHEMIYLPRQHLAVSLKVLSGDGPNRDDKAGYAIRDITRVK